MRWLAATALCLLAGLLPAGAACDRASFHILIDVGHTASAPGATSARGRTEYSFNLDLSAAILGDLLARGFRRTERLVAPDEAPRSRLTYIRAADADLMLSVHHDSVQSRYLEPWSPDGEARAFSDRFAGWSLFVSAGNPRYADSLRFAELIGAQLLRRGWPFTRHHAEPIPGEGRRWASASRGVYRFDGLAVLRASRGPAVLFEAGLIVNRAEEAVLADPGRQRDAARAVGQAVELFCAAR